MKKNCIFSLDSAKCSFNSSVPSFEGIICQPHLREIYGVVPGYITFEPENQTLTIGPYLRVASNTTIEKNTVVFPTADYINKIYRSDVHSMNQDEMNYKLNRNIHFYIMKILDNKNMTPYNKRLHYELIRNLSNDENANVSMSSTNGTCEDSHVSFKNDLRTRLNELNITINETSNAQNMFKSFNVHPNISLSPFYKFLATNCMFDYHKLPNETVPDSLCANLVYVNGVGFATTEDLYGGCDLVIMGDETGKLSVYQHKVSESIKGARSQIKHIVPDSVSMTNALRGFNGNRMF